MSESLKQKIQEKKSLAETCMKEELTDILRAEDRGYTEAMDAVLGLLDDAVVALKKREKRIGIQYWENGITIADVEEVLVGNEKKETPAK